MNASQWREERNGRARARLDRALPSIFPQVVLRHALAQALVPPTPRLAIESYWRSHVLRADRLARALATQSGQPPGWEWRLDRGRGGGLPPTFRQPPASYREALHTRGPGHCCICGQPIYRLGWHIDLWGGGTPNKNAVWHSACVVAWKLWTAPSDQVRTLKVRQRHRCSETGKRLLRTAEVDHRIPLYRVWREHRDAPWSTLLRFWGGPNLQVVNRSVHVSKCGAEAEERAFLRRRNPPMELGQ